MGQGYVLINKSKNEFISFAHISASKPRELAGNPVTSALTSWYLLKNIGDNISFIEEELVTDNYIDVTDQIIDDLILNGILRDNGNEVFWEDEPDVYIRKLENIWRNH